MNDSNLRSTLDEAGILTVHFDTSGRAVNVFSPAMMDSLEGLIESVESNPAINAVVLTSGKATFFAGADLDMVRWFTDAARSESTVHLRDVCGRLGRLFRRLEKSPKPYVAAVNGLALGGGLELALACHGRVATDEPSVQLGVPEIKLGLLPGAGGTQRLARVIGTAAALQMLLIGEPVDSHRALTLRLVDQVVPPAVLIDSAQQLARTLLPSNARAPWDRSDAAFPSAPFEFSREDVFDSIFRFVGIGSEQLAHYPAYKAIARAVVGGWHMPFDQALRWEMDCFIELIRNPVAGNMVRALFLDRQRAAKLGLLRSTSEFAQGPRALLPRLRYAKQQAVEHGCSEREALVAVTLAAIELWGEGAIVDTSLADAAVVADGVMPAYTGGPYTFAHQCGANDLRVRAETALSKGLPFFALPEGFERFIARHRDTAC